MRMETDLIMREINTQKLPKKAVKVLEKCIPLINHYRQVSSPTREIRLYREDYRELAEAAKKTGQNLTDTNYHGYRIVSE